MMELEIVRAGIYGIMLSILVMVAMLMDKALPHLEGLASGMFMGQILLIPLSLVFIVPFTYFLLVNRQADWLEFKAIFGGMDPQPHVEYHHASGQQDRGFQSTGFDFSGYKVREVKEENLT